MAPYSWASKNLQRISKEFQSPQYDRLAIGPTETPMLPPLSSLLYLRSPAGAVPRGGAPSHDSGVAQLVPTPIGRTQIFIHFYLTSTK